MSKRISPLVCAVTSGWASVCQFEGVLEMKMTSAGKDSELAARHDGCAVAKAAPAAK